MPKLTKSPPLRREALSHLGVKDEPPEVIVTVVGKNRPGVLAEVTGAIAKSHANILDIHQKVMQGYFNLFMMVDVNGTRLPYQEFKNRLERLGEGRGYRVQVQHEKIFQRMHRL